MRYPIYIIEINLYLKGEDEPIECRQEMMLRSPYDSHDQALLSLYRMTTALAACYSESEVECWDACVYFDRTDTWCYHWISHYTYNTFKTEDEAKDSLEEYVNRGPETDDRAYAARAPQLWTICTCNKCKSLGRTMIHLLGETECPA